jgi:hypothetical protein
LTHAAEFEIFTHEDDLFARIALHNKLVTLNQIACCAVVIYAEVKAGRPRRTLASLLIQRGYLSSKGAAAVEKAVHDQATKLAGSHPPDNAGHAHPKPLQERAPDGDSRVMVAVKVRGAQVRPLDSRFKIGAPGRGHTATLDMDCAALYPNDSPAFEAALYHLLETGKEKLKVNLLKLKRIPSVIIGQLGKAATEAVDRKANLIVLAKGETANVIRMVHGDLITIRGS